MIKRRIALITFGLVTILEGVVNTFLYVTSLDRLFPAADWALPLYIKMIKRPYEGNT